MHKEVFPIRCSLRNHLRTPSIKIWWRITIKLARRRERPKRRKRRRKNKRKRIRKKLRSNKLMIDK
jgi:hypothetical protein